LLDGVEAVNAGDPFYGGYLFALGLNPQDAAGVYYPSVHHDGASAAVAIVAALFCTRQAEHISQDLKEALARFAEELDLFPVNPSLYMDLSCHSSKPP
jgi:hypothetical protein